jgi:hypothetical protein
MNRNLVEFNAKGKARADNTTSPNYPSHYPPHDSPHDQTPNQMQTSTHPVPPVDLDRFIRPAFGPREMVSHITDDSSSGIIVAYMLRESNHSYEVQWGIDKRTWHLDFELRSKAHQPRQIGSWSENGLPYKIARKFELAPKVLGLGTVKRIDEECSAESALVDPLPIKHYRNRFRNRGRNKQHEGHINSEKRLIRLPIKLGFCALAFVLMCCAIWVLKTKRDPDSASSIALVTKPSTVRIDSLSPEEATRLVLTGLKIRDKDRLSEVFRLGEVKADEAISFLKQFKDLKSDEAHVEWLGSKDRDGLQIDMVVFQNLIGSENQKWLVFLTPNDQGVWQIDFDSFSRHVSPGWSDLLNGNTEQGVVRVVMRHDNYFNGSFAESDWICYQLTSPDLSAPLYGYCRKQSAQETALKAVMKTDYKAMARNDGERATLNIKRGVNAIGNQFEITEVLSGEWVIKDGVSKSQL